MGRERGQRRLARAQEGSGRDAFLREGSADRADRPAYEIPAPMLVLLLVSLPCRLEYLLQSGERPQAPLRVLLWESRLGFVKGCPRYSRWWASAAARQRGEAAPLALQAEAGEGEEEGGEEGWAGDWEAEGPGEGGGGALGAGELGVG